MNLRRVAHIESRLQSSFERRYAGRILAALKKQGESYLSNGYISNDMYRVIEQMYDDMIRFWMPRQYRQLERSTVKAVDFFLPKWFQFMQELKITELVTRVEGIDETTEKTLRDIVTEGATKGWTRGMIADKIVKATSGKIGNIRSRTISRTELGQVINTAKSRSAEDWKEETGNKLGKLWIHRGAKDPRDWHMYLDNSIAIPENSRWQVTDPNTGITDNMMYPHDPSASAGNVINCGCQVIYVRWRDNNNYGTANF